MPKADDYGWTTPKKDEKDFARTEETAVVSGDPPVPHQPSESHAQHTPGPWQVAPHSDTDEMLEIVAGYSEQATPEGTIKQAHWIAECDAAIDFDTDRERALDENAANARLIAAAPDLLAALKAIVEMYGPSTEYTHRAAAAWRVCEAAIAKAEGR